jgi:hypothetical protein
VKKKKETTINQLKFETFVQISEKVTLRQERKFGIIGINENHLAVRRAQLADSRLVEVANAACANAARPIGEE